MLDQTLGYIFHTELHYVNHCYNVLHNYNVFLTRGFCMHWTMLCGTLHYAVLHYATHDYTLSYAVLIKHLSVHLFSLACMQSGCF